MYYALALVLLLLVCAASAAPVPYPPARSYAQKLELQFGSAAEAGQAKVTVAPVYDDRAWAFSARWDDCNPNSLNMHEHMARYGLRGTFYLNRPRPDAGLDFARQLQGAGCSVGGHSLTHPKFREIGPNALYYEVLANRVEWEDWLDTPVSSFAFPNGQFADPEKPLLWETTTEAVRRAGYLHCVYAGFVRNNPWLPPGEISTGNQVVPGDRVVEAEKFQESLDKVLVKWPEEAARQQGHCLFLGVHAWQAGEEWNKLDAVFETIARKPDWWYCNQNEWAAYSRQAAVATVTAGAAAGGVLPLTVQRPVPADLGCAVPLTLVVSGAPLQAAKLAGQPLAVETRGERTVVNLPPAAEYALPARIGRIDLPAAASAAAECGDFAGLKALLVPAGDRLALTLQAPAEAGLTEIQVTYRLPLQFVPGVAVSTVADLAAGGTQQTALTLPAPRPEPVWSEGPQYYVAQVDFRLNGVANRLYVTSLTLAQ